MHLVVAAVELGDLLGPTEQGPMAAQAQIVVAVHPGIGHLATVTHVPREGPVASFAGEPVMGRLVQHQGLGLVVQDELMARGTDTGGISAIERGLLLQLGQGVPAVPGRVVPTLGGGESLDAHKTHQDQDHDQDHPIDVASG
jgi:hypothetical protein